MLAHCFYSYRICRFSGNKIKYIIICSIALSVSVLQFSLLVYYAASFIQHDSVSFGAVSGPKYSFAVYGLNFALDTAFTISMTILLHKERCYFAKTQDIINRLTFLIINTGLATTLVYLMSIILLAALPASNLAYCIPVYSLSQLYCNSILANLNSRAYVRGDRSRIRGDSSFSSSMGMSVLRINPRRHSDSQISGTRIGVENDFSVMNLDMKSFDKQEAPNV